jgi:hypothetical protein
MNNVEQIVANALDEAGIVVASEELQMLVAVYDTIRQRAASLYVGDAEAFEPADVFSAGD